MNDTAWVLFMPEIVRQFGCYWAGDGRLVGAIIDGVTYGNLFPLPVELLLFNAAINCNMVSLQWETATELNNSGFEINRMKICKEIDIGIDSEIPDGESDWIELGFVRGAGTTSRKNYYHFTDIPETNGHFKYKLIQVDFGSEAKEIGRTDIYFNRAALEYSLSQNYPNPFNPVTRISWESPVDNIHTLKVFDVLGKQVAVLVNEYKPAGKYQVEFNASGLPSGIYFYQLKAGNYV